MSILFLILPALLAALLSFALTPLARRLAVRVGAVDLPDSRKVHTMPVPRLGGLAVVTSVATLLCATSFIGPFSSKSLPTAFLTGLLAGFIPIFLISLIDDVRPLRAMQKFPVHILGAALAVSFGVRLGDVVHLFGADIYLGWFSIVISILWITGLTNAFNIVDGLDGLSAGLALISSASLVAVSLITHNYEMAIASAILSGALLGFLPHNSHPARIFLGDCGSASIGYVLACLALGGGSTLSAGMAIAIPIVVLGLPIAETLISMARRFMRRIETGGKGSVFDADRGHFHHRLLELGIDHRRAVLTLYGVGVLLAACGIASLFMTFRGAGLLLTTLLVSAFIGVRRLNYDEFALVRRGTILKMYDAPALKSALFVPFIDIALAIGGSYIAIVLKYDDWALDHHIPLAVQLMTMLPPITLAVFWTFKLYQGAWRLAGIEDFVRLSVASMIVSLLGLSAVSMWYEQREVTLTFGLIFAMVLLILTIGVRASYRVLMTWNQRSAAAGSPVLIYGAGVAGALALREMLANRSLHMKPVGFIDDDPAKHGRLVQGFAVHGGFDRMAAMIEELQVGTVVVSSDSVTEERLAGLEQLCRDRNIQLRHFRMLFPETVAEVPAPVSAHR